MPSGIRTKARSTRPSRRAPHHDVLIGQRHVRAVKISRHPRLAASGYEAILKVTSASSQLHSARVVISVVTHAVPKKTVADDLGEGLVVVAPKR